MAFTEHPGDVTAIVGGSVLIRCEYEGTSYLPYWIINDVIYTPHGLPPYYLHIANKGLYIPYVAGFMNNTKFVCAFSSTFESRVGHLTVLYQMQGIQLLCVNESKICHECHMFSYTCILSIAISSALISTRLSRYPLSTKIQVLIQLSSTNIDILITPTKSIGSNTFNEDTVTVTVSSGLLRDTTILSTIALNSTTNLTIERQEILIGEIHRKLFMNECV